jgi:YD repeat-containing protein
LGVLRSTLLKYGLRAGFVVLACCLSHAQTPTISSISPNPVGIGQSVTISGSNFGSSGSITFNGVAASTTSWASTTIIATVPAGTATGNVVVTSGGHSSSGFPFTLNNGPVSYVYDDLGRLAAVIDVNGNAAEYSYDIVGNILSISRFTSTQVSIIDFSPQSAPVGTAVTINGTGFSATPSQNTVKFNGITATVSSATNIQLQVAVPATATTGPISVTSPNGTATSSTSFTVTSSNGVPTITSFSPSSGVSTTAVSVVGTNFDPTLANDKLRLNASQAVVSAVTSTTIATTVPAATASGRFSLIAPAGNAVSSQDFYVPFGTHVPGDIGFTARIAEGGSQAITLGASQIALVLFDGIEGQHLDVGMTGTTFSTCNLYLIAPNNSTTATTSCTTGFTDLGSTYLPQTGTYTVGIDPSTSSGSITVSLSQDVLGSITIGGPQVTEATTLAGQDVRLSFTAAPGQRVVAYATNVTNPSATLNLVAPSGSILATVSINNSPSGQTFFMDTPPVPLGGGTYQLWVQHSGTNVGSETLQLINATDFAGTLTIPAAGATGPTLRVPTSGNLIAGQNASLTFSGTTGQKLSFNFTSTVGTNAGSCLGTLYDPTGAIVFNGGYGWCGAGVTYIDTTTLALTGTYTLYLDPQGTATGTMSVSINNDQDVTTPTISIGGSAVTTTTRVAGQDVRLSFTPTASQPQIAVLATSVTNPYAFLNLVAPSGSTQAYTPIDNNPSGQTFLIDTQQVTASQQYQLWVQHSGTGIGSETLQIVSVPANFTGTLTVPAAGVKGPATRVPTSGNLALGQNASLTFSGTAGQKLSFNLTSTIGTNAGSCLGTLYDPSGTILFNGAYGDCGAGATYIDTITLDLTGTYKFYLAPQGTATGTVSISINNAQDVTTPAISIGGSAVTAKTTVAGQDVRLSFTPTASQPRIAVLATNVTNPYATLNLVTPAGSTVALESYPIDNNPSGQTFFLNTEAVTASQVYQLWVQHSGANFGNESLQIKNVPANISHTVTVGGTAYTFSTVIGQQANIQFTISTSESVTVHWTSGTYPSTPGCTMTVTGPSPSTNEVGAGNCATATGTLSLGTLASGTYNILIDPLEQEAGGMSLTVTSP